MVDVRTDVNIDLSAIDPSRVLLRSDNALGHGNFDELTDVVYVKTDNYSAGNNPLIADEIEQLNARFLAEAEIMCSSAPVVGDRATLGSVCP